MMEHNQLKVSQQDNILILERIFNYPVEMIYDSFTDGRMLEEWWGPKGIKTTNIIYDFRPGGIWFFKLNSEYGVSFSKSIFQEISENRFSYIDYFSDEEGNELKEMGSSLIDNQFESIPEGTKFTTTITFESKEKLEESLEMKILEGIESTLNRLDDLLSQL
ncbi:SRPBCC domain-containing protein [Macrococcus sp. DPC7161]|uniref:SRPBCC family protein n=1 Tax=Macrococcus sp. DPC7161 TaxID=2507060 RepID=UPI00100A4A28|nr:SRPBCC domain-containing protein [Macrococcus sp. DPC7161]RXK17281.1 SRPBCC domain-containing protein [Macrococcus sp. DPC7161]